MGMFRDAEPTEIDIVKEMAEGLGSAGVRLEELLEKTDQAGHKVRSLIAGYDGGLEGAAIINEAVRAYNTLVDKAEEALQRLLIQREACGFRTHKNVDHYYPIPKKMKPFNSIIR